MTKDGDLPKPDLNVLKYSSESLKFEGFTESQSGTFCKCEILFI